MIGALALLAIPTLAAGPTTSPASPGAHTFPVAPAQQGQTETVTGRVTTFMDGTGAVIDRGSIDGLYTGDRVIFSVRGGREYYGTVMAVEGRVAVVRVEDPSFKPEPGTPARIEVPLARFEQDPVVPPPTRQEPPPVRPPSGAGIAGGGVAAEQGRENEPAEQKPNSDWSFADEDWTMDMPLLAQVDAILPAERRSSWSGRTYFSFDQIIDTEDDRGDTFARGGLALFGDNPFGKGGRLHLDGEVNYRKTVLPEPYVQGEDITKFRLDRLSYSIGGTRFTPSRWEFGRFLQSGMPEFGVLDGAEWSSRFDNGDRFGASVGYLPEPTPNQDSFQDLSVSAWYRWVSSVRETLSATAGFQKTWHNGTDDRDLLIAKIEYVPINGWNFFANAWVDFYDQNDDQYKQDGASLTYAIVDLRKRLSEKNGISFEYRHQEYPQLLRYEYPPVAPRQLQDAFVDRFGFTGWRWIDGTADLRGKRLFLRVGGWTDENDAGGDGELGIDIHGVLGDRGRLDVAVFGAQGKFTSHIGGRVRYGRYGPSSSWSILFEAYQNDITSFLAGQDDLLMYRGRWNYEFFRASGFSANLSTDVLIQDTESQLFLGLFLQQSF